MQKEQRSFGLIVGGFLAGVGVYYAFAYSSTAWPIFLFSAFIVGLALLYPNALYHPYRGWIFFGEKIGHITNKVILLIFFLGFLTPVSLVRRIFIRDPLCCHFRERKESYFEYKFIHDFKKFEKMF